MPKKYKDTFGKDLKTADVEAAVRLICQTKKPTTMLLTQYLKFGVAKSNKILKLLDDAKVTTTNEQGERVLVLRGAPAATNAALRQLKKGNTPDGNRTADN